MGAVRVATVRAPEPFIPLTMLKEPVVFGIVMAGFFSIGTIIGLSIFIPLYVELVLAIRQRLGRRADRLHGRGDAGLDGGGPADVAVGPLQARAGLRRRSAIVALIIFAVWPAGLSLAPVTVLIALGGAGMGPMYPATTVIIQNAVPLHQLGIATGTLNFFRSLGGAIIVAVFAAIVLGGLDAGGALHARQTVECRVVGAAAFAATVPARSSSRRLHFLGHCDASRDRGIRGAAACAVRRCRYKDRNERLRPQ